MHLHFSNYNRPILNERQTPATPMTPKQGIIFGIIFIIFGIILLIFSISTLISYNEKNKTYLETTATVVDHNYNTDGLEAIIVEYTVDGQTYKKNSNTYSETSKPIGTEVQIKYNPNNPSNAIWVNDSSNIVMPLVGGLFTLLGIFLIISSIKAMIKKKNTPALEKPNGLFDNSETINAVPNNQNNI